MSKMRSSTAAMAAELEAQNLFWGAMHVFIFCCSQWFPAWHRVIFLPIGVAEGACLDCLPGRWPSHAKGRVAGAAAASRGRIAGQVHVDDRKHSKYHTHTHTRNNTVYCICLIFILITMCISIYRYIYSI